MTTNNLLDDNDDTINVDPTKNYLEELVGDGKKFKSAEELARGKFESDEFIRLKNKQFDDLRADYLKLDADYKARAKLEELIDQLQQKQLASSDDTIDAKEVKQPMFDPKAVESLVSSKIQEHELNKMQQANHSAVKDKLIERYGQNYQPVIKQHIDELGISEDLFNTLAKTNPKLLYRTLGLDQAVQRESFQAPVRTSQNSDGFLPKGGAKRTWSYYQKLKKDNPRVYTDPKTHNQMMKDYQDLGKDFEDGNFHSL